VGQDKAKRTETEEGSARKSQEGVSDHGRERKNGKSLQVNQQRTCAVDKRICETSFRRVGGRRKRNYGQERMVQGSARAKYSKHDNQDKAPRPRASNRIPGEPQSRAVNLKQRPLAAGKERARFKRSEADPHGGVDEQSVPNNIQIN